MFVICIFTFKMLGAGYTKFGHVISSSAEEMCQRTGLEYVFPPLIVNTAVENLEEEEQYLLTFKIPVLHDLCRSV